MSNGEFKTTMDRTIPSVETNHYIQNSHSIVGESFDASVSRDRSGRPSRQERAGIVQNRIVKVPLETVARSWRPINDISLEHVMEILESSAEVVAETLDHDDRSGTKDEYAQLYREKLSRILAK